jgi:hypothetical protein
MSKDFQSQTGEFSKPLPVTDTFIVSGKTDKDHATMACNNAEL